MLTFLLNISFSIFPQHFTHPSVIVLNAISHMLGCSHFCNPPSTWPSILNIQQISINISLVVPESVSQQKCFLKFWCTPNPNIQLARLSIRQLLFITSMSLLVQKRANEMAILRTGTMSYS